MFCFKCGNQIESTGAFCAKCGARVGDGPGTGTATLEPPPLHGTTQKVSMSAVDDLSLFDYFKRCVTERYAAFNGRARRKEFWSFALFTFLFAFGLAFIDGLIGSFDEDVGFGVLSVLFILALIIPNLAVFVRRLHDLDMSGAWILMSLVPLVGFIFVIVIGCIDSKPGGNEYGPNPKGL
jgi:uncharacterized membrane protein YhaH (DUF805 family)